MNDTLLSSNGNVLHSDVDDQLESFRRSDEARSAFLDNLVRQYQMLQVRYQEKCDDLANEVNSRRQWQSHASAQKRDLDIIRQQTDSNVFALAIIDGDGAIFQDRLLSAIADGGSEAGHILYNEIKRHLQERHGSTGDWTIIVQIYANFEGLSRKLAHVGIIKNYMDLYAFARSFSCSQPLFSFIDVGSGKERADHKIKEMLRLFMFNTHCKEIIFGGAHDNGYLPNLEPFKRDSTVIRKLTLLATTPPEPGFSALGMHITRFQSVFRTEPLPQNKFLPDRSTSRQNSGYAPIPTIPLTNTSAHSLSPSAAPAPQSPTEDKHGLPTAAAASIAPLNGFSNGPRRSSSSQEAQESSPTAEPGPIPKAASVSAESGSGAQASKTTMNAITSNNGNSNTNNNNTTSSKLMTIVREQPKTATTPAKAVYLNSYDQRLDMTLPKPETAAMINLNQRIKTRKVCNNYHLLNYCSAEDFCTYSHEPKLPPKELQALRVKARERPCVQGSDCRDVDCTCGHLCPRGQDCDSKYCYFDDDAHDVDRALKMKYYSNGEIEILP